MPKKRLFFRQRACSLRRAGFCRKAAKTHTCSLRGIFPRAHVAVKNDPNFLPPAGGKLCEAGAEPDFAGRGQTVIFASYNPPEGFKSYRRRWLRMDAADYWQLFCDTGAPEAYMLFRGARQEEGPCPRNR